MTEAVAEPARNQRTVRVLLCDDDRFMGAALADLVRDTPDLELVGLATDTDAAVTLAVTLRPDVVLLDVRMPGGGGARAAKLIRERIQDIRLIAFSAHSDRREVLAMLQAGAGEYLVKGVDGDTAIIEALRGDRGGRPGLSHAEADALVTELVELLAASEARAGDAQEQVLQFRRRGWDEPALGAGRTAAE